MRQPIPGQSLYSFGVFRADLSCSELQRQGVPVKIQEKPLQMLALLLERRGDVVTREELRQKLWPSGTYVEFDDALNTAVKKLRAALQDSAENPRFIETVPRRGWRFIAPVEVIAPNGNGGHGKTVEQEAAPGDAETQIPRSSTPERENRAFRGPRYVREDKTESALPSEARNPGFAQKLEHPLVPFAMAAVVLMAAVAAVLILKNPHPSKNGPSAGSGQALVGVPAGGALNNIHSLAVLPLKNLSNDPAQSYFADGMTDELITRLAALEGLRVISHTSVMRYKETAKSLPEIAAELHVDAIVEGTLLPFGNRVRVSAQLVQGANDQHLWAESYERDTRDVLSLQNEVARDIARQISLKLTPAAQTHLASSRAVDPEALHFYLRGRAHWRVRHGDDLHKAVAEFQKAIAIDPNYAPAYAGLVDCYVILPMLAAYDSAQLYPKAKQAAEKALALDPTLAEVHNSMGYAKMYQDWDFAGAKQEFQEAIRLNPNYSTAHQWYAELLSLEGRSQEAIAEIQKAEELDPFAAIVYHQAGGVYRDARQYDRAADEYKKSLALDPHFAFNYFGLGDVYWRKGMYHEWAETGRAALQGLPHKHTAEELRLTSEAEALCRHGDIRGCVEKSMEATKLQASRPSYYLARSYAFLGDDAKAFEYAERAYAAREHEVFRINIDPEWDRLRSDPRYIVIMKKVGLPRPTPE